MKQTRKKQKGGKALKPSRRFVSRFRKVVSNSRKNYGQHPAHILFPKRKGEKETSQEPTAIKLCGTKCIGGGEHNFLDTDLNVDLIMYKKANNKNNPYTTVPYHGQVCETCLCLQLKKGHKSYGDMSTLNIFDEYDREEGVKQYLLNSRSNTVEKLQQ